MSSKKKFAAVGITTGRSSSQRPNYPARLPIHSRIDYEVPTARTKNRCANATMGWSTSYSSLCAGPDGRWARQMWASYCQIASSFNSSLHRCLKIRRWPFGFAIIIDYRRYACVNTLACHVPPITMPYCQ